MDDRSAAHRKLLKEHENEFSPATFRRDTFVATILGTATFSEARDKTVMVGGAAMYPSKNNRRECRQF